MDESTQEKASLYAFGLLTGQELLEFKQRLESDDDLRQLVEGLSQLPTQLPPAFSRTSDPQPSPSLKQRILSIIGEPSGFYDKTKHAEETGIVVADRNGRVVWVNEAFSQMCGFSIEELRGRKPGALLQGAKTDPSTVARMREAVRRRETCSQQMLNYHKDGSAYEVMVSLMPLRDDKRGFHGFVALEQKLA